MKHIQCNKIVRDRIAEIVESSGKICTVGDNHDHAVNAWS